MASTSRFHRLVTLTVLGGAGSLLGACAATTPAPSSPPGDLVRATEVTEAAGDRAPDTSPTRAELVGPDDPDIRAALERTLVGGIQAPDHDDHIALRLSCAMSRAWYLQGRSREGSDYLERALASDRDAPELLRANALHMSGVLHDERRETERAMERLEASLELLRGIGDTQLIARELNSLGVVARIVTVPGSRRAFTYSAACPPISANGFSPIMSAGPSISNDMTWLV